MKKNNIYYAPITIENIRKIWNIVKRTCKNKRAVNEFALNENTNIMNIYNVLMNNSYKAGRFILFIIFQPKPRLVMSQSIFDKIVNHFVANYYLNPYLSPKLIEQNVATRKGKGTSYALKYVKDSLNTLIMQNKDKPIYSLKLDIRKYFYNIDHDILLSKLRKDIKDKNVIRIIEAILVETNKPYVNEFVDIYNNKFKLDIPYYRNNVGLSIGAQSSQFLAIYYLSDLDHYLKEVMKCKYYIRYQDDIVIFDTDKEKLKYVWKKTKEFLKRDKLELNQKSNIFNMKNGINFLGYNYKVINGKLKINYYKKTYKKITHKLNYFKNHDIDYYYKSYASYYGYFEYINKNVERNFVMSVEERYKELKEKFPNYLVFVKDKGFYITYKDDAVITWDLLRYKYKDNDSVSFGSGAYNNVIKELEKSGLNYVIYDESENVVTNDSSNKIYNLMKQVSAINYEKYKDEMDIRNKVERILKSDKANTEDLRKYLNKKVEELDKLSKQE